MLDARVRAEWDRLTSVYMHKPGLEMFFGLLDPQGSLYERAFDRSAARREHDFLSWILKKDFNVPVHFLKKEILSAASSKQRVRNLLVEKARESVDYLGDRDAVNYAIDEFEANYKYYDSAHFFYMWMLKPIIHVKSKPEMGLGRNMIETAPLFNLYFMRDQQFVTDKGIVLTRMATPSRRGETEVTKFLWEEVLGLPIYYEMKDPAVIEGGEFIPLDTFALVGIGSRTNQEAINQLTSLDFNYEEIGVVHQPLHPLVPSSNPDPMINMHLDTYFNIASKGVAVGCVQLLKQARTEIYRNVGGHFEKDEKVTNLYDYIKSKGFEVINITTLEQMSYASNFLCIKDKQVLAVQTESVVDDVMATLRRKARNNPERYGQLYAQAQKDYDTLKDNGQFFPHKGEMSRNGISSYPINIKNLTGGFGAAHCMTCSLSRGLN